MADSLITSSMITNETLRILQNESAFLPRINKQYNDQFAQGGAKAGQTVNVRRPVEFTIRDGAAISTQDVTETQVPITINPEFGIDWDFQDRDLSLSIDKFSERYLMPAGRRLAAELDYRIGALYKQVWNFSGTAGTTPSTAAHLLAAGQKLDESSCPMGDRSFVLTPVAQASVVGGLSGLFNSQPEIAKQYKSGQMGSALGFDFGMSQNLPSHTVGVLGGTPLVNGANQSATGGWTNTGSLITDAWTAAAATRLKAGDVFTIANVYAVNRLTKASTGSLQQFTVVSDAASDGSGNMTITISPAIITAGAYQNVDSVPADNAALTIVSGTASLVKGQNMAFHKDAFTLVTVDMPLPNGVDMASRSNYDGVALRFIRDYDITNNRRICRFDILAGFAALRPEWAVRVPN